MNYARSTNYVKKIVDSKDNIVGQLKELSKFKNRKGVRQYIDRLIDANTLRDYDLDAKYILYCIVKYYYGLEVKDENEPLIIPDSLDIITPADYDMDFIAKLLDSKDNIIDQCKLLKEHKDSLDVQNYISHATAYYNYDAPVIYGLSTEYEMYCINKYFYGKDIPKVKSNHVKLGVWVQNRHKSIPEEEVSEYTPVEEVKKGDNVKILTGPFKNLQATITDIDLDNDIIKCSVNLFGEDTTVEIAKDDKVLKESDKNE